MSESYTPVPYPRMLYKGTEQYHIVKSKAEELAAREDGWRNYGEVDPDSEHTEPPLDPEPPAGAPVPVPDAPKNKGGRPRKNPEA